MAMYAIGTLPLVQQLDGIVKQTWYADDLAAASKLVRTTQDVVGLTQ